MTPSPSRAASPLLPSAGLVAVPRAPPLTSTPSPEIPCGAIRWAGEVLDVTLHGCPVPRLWHRVRCGLEVLVVVTPPADGGVRFSVTTLVG